MPALIRGVVPIIPLRRIEEAVEFDPFQEPEAIQLDIVPEIIQLRRVQEVFEPQPVGQQQLAVEPALFDMANQQMIDLMAMMANNLAQMQNRQAVRSSTLAAIPTFSGGITESLADWEAAIARVSLAEGWEDPMKRQVAIGKLTGTALAWHHQTGHTLELWNDWLAGLRLLFQPRLSLTEWCLLVEGRRHIPGEHSAQYAMEKAKLCRLCPHPLNEADIVTYLVRGLSRPDHVSALMANPPATIDGFIDAMRRMEQTGSLFNPTGHHGFTPTGAHATTGPNAYTTPTTHMAATHVSTLPQTAPGMPDFTAMMKMMAEQFAASMAHSSAHNTSAPTPATPAPYYQAPTMPSPPPASNESSLVQAVTDSMKRMETIVQGALQSQQAASSWRNRQSQQQDRRQWSGSTNTSNAHPPMQQQDQRQWNNNPMISSSRPPSPATQQHTVTQQSRPQTQMQSSQWNGPPQRQRTPLDKVDCFRCGLMGHYQNDCPGRIATIHQGNEQASLQG